MDKGAFWQIVQETHDATAGDMDAKCNAIRARLLSLSATDVLASCEHFDRAMDRAYDWRIWGAAFVIHGGCSDDTFSDFRASLISRGRQSFELALSDPDALADGAIDDDAWFYEGYQYAISDAIRAKHPSARPTDPRGWLARTLAPRSDLPPPLPPRYAPAPHEPAGKQWSEGDLPDLYPKLWKRFV